MSHNSQTEQTAKAVPCFVALLFSLAAIADWAATMPGAVRYPVLLILRRAEAIAWSYIYWQAHDHGLTIQWALPDACRQHSDPDAAMMLGWWFRILAVTLRGLPRRVLIATKARAGWRVSQSRLGRAHQRALVASPAPDTS